MGRDRRIEELMAQSDMTHREAEFAEAIERNDSRAT